MPNISAVIGMPVNASAGLFNNNNNNNNRNRFGLSFRAVERMVTFQNDSSTTSIFANKEEGFQYVAS
jgi:hypothetical protein